MVREIGRIIISLCLLALAGFLFYLGFKLPEPAQALGIGAVAGGIVSALLVYWLKPG